MKIIVVKHILVANPGSDFSNIEAVRSALEAKYPESFRFHIILPEENTYKIAEIKRFISRLSRKPLGDSREDAYVLSFADGMSAICQNALLKTLEDSPHSIILLAKNPDGLLPTVRSRCIETSVVIDTPQNNDTGSSLTGFDDIASLAKMERDAVRSILERNVRNVLNTNIHQVLLFESAIKKLDANCKVESVLYELVYQLTSNK